MTTQTRSKRPSHEAFVVEGEGDKKRWTKIGAAWTHDDGDGMTLNLSALPITGRVVIRELKAQDDTGSQGERAR